MGYRPGRIWLGDLEAGRSPVKNAEFKCVIVRRDLYFDYKVTVEFIPTWDAKEITSHVAEFAAKDMKRRTKVASEFALLKAASEAGGRVLRINSSEK